MADKAKDRMAAIGKQLQPVQRVAAGSNTPRAKGKVVIITGK